MRDAIVLSGWRWETCNVPERIALALAHAGARVLYCENPVSFIREARPLTEVSKGVFAFRPVFLSHRLNRIPLFLRTQSQALTDQILQLADEVKLHEPFLVYPHGDYCLGLCREFKRRGFPLIHVCMDYELDIQIEHARQSDLTLAIPRAAFEQLRAQFGDKVHILPQLSMLNGNPAGAPSASLHLATVPRPLLGYMGDLVGRVSIPLLEELLSKHPEWSFVSFGSKKRLALPNEYVLPWSSPQELQNVLAALDVGFMPYDYAKPYNLHCVPLKLFDYFATGMPVVSTPIAAIREYEDLIYVGGTASELAGAITVGLNEPESSPKREKRVAVAQEHSLENVSQVLRRIVEGHLG